MSEPKRERFTFYRGFYEAIIDLPDKDRLQAYDAICKYGICDDEPESKLSPIAKAIFTVAKPNIDAGIKRYENGCKGGNRSKEP